jgi:hypothetical protein
MNENGECNKVTLDLGWTAKAWSLSTKPVQWVPLALSPGREAGQSSPSSVDVKNTWIYTSTPPYVIMV